MGFKISWLAVSGLSRAELLAREGLLETGGVQEFPEARLSLVELPQGRLLLFANDFDFVNEKSMAFYSQDALLIGCQLHEGVMFSAAYGYENGRRLWSVEHYSERGIYDLQVEGAPPPELKVITAGLRSQQDAEGGASADVDFIFDVPVDLCQALTAYRHDLMEFDWGQPAYMELRTIDAGSRSERG